MNDRVNAPGAHPGYSSTVRGVILIASTYVYFLLFAQFAFLHAVQASARTPMQLRLIMAAMAVGGLLSSLGTAQIIRPERLRRILSGSFVGCGATALLALSARSALEFAFVSASIGICLGALTVCLSSSLPVLISRRWRGLSIGLGTGLAYAICNVPAIFVGSIGRQAVVAATLCAVAVVAIRIGPFPQYDVLDPERQEEQRPFLPLVILFLALVWLDSAAFAIMQTTASLNQFGWGSESLQWSNGGIHLAIALLAGHWLDRGGRLSVLALAFICLASAAYIISSSHPNADQAHWIYASGVSLYSTALVFVPVSFASCGCVVVARRAGLLFGVAGWCGSVLGIGMAQDLHTIPIWFIGAAGIVVGGQLVWSRSSDWYAMLKSPVSSWALAGTVILLSEYSFGMKSIQEPSFPASPSVALGREVYIQEGCIHCHSQFPRTEPAREQIAWGPAADAEFVAHEKPPLIGNRRQGPDLLRIGTRRSAAWNRLHLIDPQSIVPHSRMPCYAYLFHDGDSRGDSLVAYLSALGEDTMVSRLETRQNWQPETEAVSTTSEKGAILFHEHCAACHGDSGDGQGRLAEFFGERPPRDLTRAQWQFISSQETASQRLVEIARLIKFGIPSTSMPGHETLADRELLSLACYVESLQNAAPRR